MLNVLIDFFRLVNKWKKMFSTEFFDQFSLKQYPLLIGIMPLYGQQTDAGFTIEYQFRTLVIGNWLKRHSEAINRKIFFNHIKNFKAQCDRNVNNLVDIAFFVYSSPKNIIDFSHSISSKKLVYPGRSFLKLHNIFL